MAVVLVTGSNRGIGLELCRAYAKRGDDVIAVCRTGNTELDGLNARVIDGVDVSEDAGVGRLKKELGDTRLDILVNNAGILIRDTLESVNYDDMLEQYRVNTLGPLRVTRALLGNLGDGSRVGIVSSRVGSIEDNGSGSYYGYRSSKVAVNMIGMNLHHDLSQKGIAIAILHPGYVATDMTDGTGSTSPMDSAAGLIERIDELTLENSGSFWHAEGYSLPW